MTNTTPIYNPSLLKKGEEYFLDYYTQEKPKFQPLFVGHMPNKDYGYNQSVMWWEKSKQQVKVHPSCVDAFKQLAKSLGFSDPRAFSICLGQGIDLPPDRIYFEAHCDKCMEKPCIHSSVKIYAFLKTASSEDKKDKWEAPNLNDKELVNMIRGFPASGESQEDIWNELDDIWNEVYDIIHNDATETTEILKSKYEIKRKQ